MSNAFDVVSWNEKQYSEIEEYEVLKLAVEQMNIQIFVYDMLLKRIYFFTHSADGIFGGKVDRDCTVDEILKKKIIDPFYLEVFQSLFTQIENGEKAVEARILFHSEAGGIWNQVSLFNCYNEEHSPVRAIGTIQNISHRAEVEQKYSREEKYRLTMLADFHRIYEINVTRDRFIRLKSIQDSTDCDTWDSYTESMNHLREACVYKEDWDVFLAIASRTRLLQGFREGKTEFYCEYRTVDEQGDIAWSSSATHLLKDPISDDIKGFIYVKDIDEQKKRELELEQQAESDPLTGIYNRRTAEKMISKLLLAANDEKKQYAFLTIDMDDFKHVNDIYGHVKGDYLLKQVAQKVSALLTDKDIFARLGGDEFIIFLHTGNDGERLERITALIGSVIQGISIDKNDPYHPSVSIGVSASPDCGLSFEKLYETSDKALYRAKQCGKGCVERY